MTAAFEPYEKLTERMRELALVSSTGSVLAWDQETHMPPKAITYRADQLAFLSGWTHRLFTAPEVGDWMKACEEQGYAEGSVEAVNLREWRRRYDRQVRVPVSLVEELERVRTLAREAWVAARKRSNFPHFRPHLEKIIALNRQLADCWGFEVSPYDALLEEYEPGVRTAALRQLFLELKPAIAGVLGPAVERSAAVPERLLDGDYPIPAQEALNREVAAAFGFDFEAGRVDMSAHPFCTGLGPGDCRLTTRYNVRDFTQSLYSVLHEVGHGLYEQGLLPEHFGLPMGSAGSLGIHESQSRLWENHVGRHRSFWEHWYAVACRHLPDVRRFSPEQVWAAVNRVAPSFIRVEADPVTYDLHIVLRFEIEVRLLEGELKGEDVPVYWNESFEKLFGLKVPNDAVGCLQDIHWSLSSLGYFPTYTLGNLNAAQLFHRAGLEVSGLAESLRTGSYEGLLAWLRKKIHEQGCRYVPQRLMEFATGEPTQAKYHVAHLRQTFCK
jgi:carboxypeptidase Taq